MKTLIMVRHAKAEDRSASGKDFDRELTKRGKSDASALADVLLKTGLELQLCISSSAHRAQSTAKILLSAFSPETSSLEFRADLYLADEEGLINTIRDIDQEISCAMLVGHNPGLVYAINSLTQKGAAHMPTCAAVILEMNCENWADVVEGCARVLRTIVPLKAQD